jgi:hypothetical protein
MKKKLGLAAFFVVAAAIAVSQSTGVGRGLWYPYYAALVGHRTHVEVLAELAPRYRSGLEATLESFGISYPPERLTLVGLKQEKMLEVWASDRSDWKLVRTYPVLAASGDLGPKLREGDLQVPEGVYRLTELNPRSSYHLSVRVDYPNSLDRAVAQRDGRTNLGGDIFIHGKAVSVGCVAIGDAAIEELYLILADTGLHNTGLILAPSAEPKAATRSPAWVQELYDRLRDELEVIRCC